MERQRDGITRRDFLDGVAISAAGLAAAAAAPHLTGAEAALASHGHKPPKPLPPGYHPPTETGLKGIRDDVLKQTIRIDGLPNQKDVHSTRGGPGIHAWPHDDHEVTYDCVIVGAGGSGLAAAKFYRDRFGPDSKILLLDPLRDFGGHSHRNEFHIPNAAAGGADVMILRNGGTVNLDTVSTWNEPAGGLLDIPGSYGQPALDMLEFCGVDPDNFPGSGGAGIPTSFGLRAMLLFPAKDWGQDHVVQNRLGSEDWPTFLARTPYNAAAREAITRIQTDETTDWISLKHGPKTDQEKKAILSRLTYRQYLMKYLGANEQAMIQYQRLGHGLLGAGAQAVSAGDMWALGNPGFDGLALNADIFPGIGRTPQFALSPTAEESPSPTWPDGNASLLRLLVGKLIPGSIGDVDGAPPTQETIVKAQADYTKLDHPGNTVRIRLNSLVFRVKPGKGRDKAKVDYILDGRARRVEARHVVMACWNRVTAHIVEGLPKKQVEGLCYARKVPLIYGRAGFNNWQAFADAKVSGVSPRGNSLFWDSTTLQAGARFGTAYGPTPNNNPASPASVSFTVVPTDHRATPQLAAYEGGRKRLLEMSFRDLERAFVDVLDRTLNTLGGNFEPERDIHSLMINRWNYGYAHEMTSVWDPSLYGPVAKQPQVIGRQPYRNVAVANSDSAAFAYTHSAINEGYRAVQDLPQR